MRLRIRSLLFAPAALLLISARPAQATSSTWTGPGADFNTASNWSAGVPTDVANFTNTGPVSVSFSADSSLNSLSFDPLAPTYTLTTAGGNINLNGLGISNASPNVPLILNSNGFIHFSNSATAGNAAISNFGLGVNIEFNNSSSADHSTITNGSMVNFNDFSTAANATISNSGSGYTVFDGNSMSGHATITNQPCTSSFYCGVLFYGQSTADHASITNNTGAQTIFAENSTAGNATFTNTGYFAYSYFVGSSSAGNGSFVNTNLGETGFDQNSTAANAIITNSSGGYTAFYSSATAGNAIMTNNNDGAVSFNDITSAAHSTIINNSGGTTYFSDHATADQVTIFNNTGATLDISRLTSSGLILNVISGGGSVVLGSRSLTLGGSGLDTALSGDISGIGGSLVKTGAGTLTLTGANTYTGGTELDGGSLIVAGGPVRSALENAKVSVAQVGSPLGAGDFTLNSGILKTVDGSFGAIQVAGNYFQNGGTLELKLGGGANTGLYDQLQVGGVAHLGGRLQLDLVGGAFIPGKGTTIQLVQASSIQGDFEAMGQAAGLGLNFFFDPQSGILNVLLFQNPFAFLAVTGNQRAVASVIDQFSQAPTGDQALLVGALDTLSAAQVPSALEALSPQRFEMYSDVAFRTAAFMSDEVGHHLERLRAGSSGIDMVGMLPHQPSSNFEAQLADAFPNSPLLASAQGGQGGEGSSSYRVSNNLGAFVSGNAIFGNLGATADLEKSNFTTAGTMGGLDYRLGDHLAAGALMSYTNTQSDLDEQGSNASITTYSPGLYATYFSGPLYVDGVVSYGQNSYTSSRRIVFTGIDRTAESQTKGRQYLLNADAGYEFRLESFNLSPTLGMNYAKLHVDGFTETGADSADLAVSSQEADSLRTRLGGKLDKPFTARGITWDPEVRAVWQHEYLDDSRLITAQFSQPSSGFFSVQTTLPARDSALLGGGITARWLKNVDLYLDYTAQVGQRNSIVQGVQGGGRLRF